MAKDWVVWRHWLFLISPVTISNDELLLVNRNRNLTRPCLLNSSTLLRTEMSFTTKMVAYIRASRLRLSARGLKKAMYNFMVEEAVVYLAYCDLNNSLGPD